MTMKISPTTFTGHKPNKKSSSKHPDKEEYIRLVNRFQDSKKSAEKKQIAEKVVAGTEGLVVSIAASLLGRVKNADMDDLVQVGRIGVLKAMASWKRDIAAKCKGSFTSYAAIRVRAEIYRYNLIEGAGVVAGPRNVREHLKDNPAYQLPTSFISWDEPFSDNDENSMTKGDMACISRGIEEERADTRLGKEELRVTVSKTLSEILKPRELELVQRRLDGETHKSIGGARGRSRQAAHIMYVRTMEKVRDYIAEKYPDLSYE